jgi:hypothetical protein
MRSFTFLIESDDATLLSERRKIVCEADDTSGIKAAIATKCGLEADVFSITYFDSEFDEYVDFDDFDCNGKILKGKLKLGRVKQRAKPHTTESSEQGEEEEGESSDAPPPPPAPQVSLIIFQRQC